MGRAPIAVDFETEAIQPRPDYPPVPVGVAVAEPGKKPRYFAWGHPEKNNCTKAQADQALKDIWRSGAPLLFHNAAFDLEVAHTHHGLPYPAWDAFDDTLFSTYLLEPHAPTLSLKPTAERVLGMKPEEQNRVRQWLIDHGIVRKGDKDWGAHICKAPGDLVGSYAVGDVVRTLKLHEHNMAKIVADIPAEGLHSMLVAYNRERRLLPILLRNEEEGARVDLEALELDVPLYEAQKEKADNWLRKRLKAPDLNLDSGEEYAEALSKAGVVTEFVTTKTGKRSVAKGNLTPDMYRDPLVASAYGYRQRIDTCLSMFMRPWLELARANRGRIYTKWNQVRGDSGGGARTGRLTCSPNWQNLTKSWTDKDDGYAHPKKLYVLELPLVRKYILPDDKRSSFGHRDYNQQELRILAHFEGDILCDAYNKDPNLDVHTFVQKLIGEITGLQLERRSVKVLNFGLVYGMGVGKLAQRTGTDVETAKRLKEAQRKAIPGLRELEKSIKKIGRSDEPIRTWGGRLYYTEPPKRIQGIMRTFEYKLLNYLIQGSAADCTKEAIIRYNDAKKDGRFLVTVHDEINISAPKGAIRSELAILRDVMKSVEFDVPMLSDAKVGPSWGDLKKLDEAA